MKTRLSAACTDLAGNPISYWNLIWDRVVNGRPMRLRAVYDDAGKYVGTQFCPPHPCHENPRPTVWGRHEQPETDDPLGKLRARGYLASCFPVGDGISFDPPQGRTVDEVAEDFRECFGFEVEIDHRGGR